MEDKYRKDFENFPVLDYLLEYYNDLNDENKFLLWVYHNFYSQLNGQYSLLEVGGGPTIYQLISASRIASQILFTDICKDNIDVVKKWFKGEVGAFDWSEYFLYAEELEGSLGLEHRLRKANIGFMLLDVFDGISTSADIVSANFCPESITDDAFEYMRLLNRIKNSAEKYLIMVALRNASFYKIFNSKFVAYPVGLGKIRELLGNDFKIIQSYSMDCNPARGYDGIVAIMARRTR